MASSARQTREVDAAKAEIAKGRTDAEAAVDGAAERIVTRPAPSTHTPGPWKWDESWGAIVVDRPDMQKLICPMWTGCDRARMGRDVVDEDLANARLIAAAPDLYAALNAMVEADDAHWPLDTALAIRNAARAALAKASPR